MSDDYAPRPRTIPPAVALPLLRDRLERLRGELGPFPTFAGTQHVGILLGVVRDALDVLEQVAGCLDAAETRRLAAVRRAQRQAAAPPAGASMPAELRDSLERNGERHAAAVSSWEERVMASCGHPEASRRFRVVATSGDEAPYCGQCGRDL